MMKIAGKQRKTTAGLCSKSKAGTGLSCTKSGTSIGKTTKRRNKRKGNEIASLELEQSEPMETSNKTSEHGNPGRNMEIRREFSRVPIQPPALQAHILGTSLQKAAPETPTLLQGRSPEGFKKLKLQLFPIDDVTRQVLEKDNCNPFLELTLGTQKKISSVVKHLNTKWSNSNAASGELILFPFSARLDNLAVHKRWTWRDSATTAADVYAAIGNPSVFRLRYGWLSNLEPNVCAIPSTPIHIEDNLLAGEYKNMNAAGEKIQHSAELSKGHALVSTDSLNQRSGTPVILDTNNQATDKDNLRKCNGTTLSWLDCLSNMSFGALLSEAARDTSHGPSLPNTSLQQIPNFDSFDAALAGLVARKQGTSISCQASSILDAEETCHAFSLQKTTLSGKEVPDSSREAPFMVPASSGGTPSVSCTQNINTNFTKYHIMPENFTKYHIMPEVVSHVVHTQDHANQEHASRQLFQTNDDGSREPTADLQLAPQDGANEELAVELQQHTEGSNNNCNSFGKMDTYWPESLGPWQYNAASSKEMIGGDSIGLTGLIESSLDAFQSFSIF